MQSLIDVNFYTERKKKTKKSEFSQKAGKSHPCNSCILPESGSSQLIPTNK